MEISVEQRLTGREMRDDILRRHGSRTALESAAGGGDLAAQDDLATLRLLDDRPARLDEVFEVREISRATVDDVARLSRGQLSVLQFLADHPGATKTDVMHGLGLAWGTVCYQVQRLAEMGAVRSLREGRRVRLSVTPGLDIHITTPPRPVSAARSKR